MYTPPYTITERILTLVSAVSEKVGSLNVYGTSRKPHLRRNSRIQSIHASLKIEANSLSIDAVRDVISGRSVIGPANEIREVQNAFEAYGFISHIDPYSIRDLKKVHGILVRGLQDEAGVFRSGNEGVFSGGKCIFMAPPPRMVHELMENLFEWMRESRNRVHPLVLSAVFHYEFVFIHPFSDGNGRTARLWHTALLSRWHSIFEYIPIESQIEKFQSGYYEAIAACHRQGDSTRFIEFMLEQIAKVLDTCLEEVSQPDGSISEYVRNLLAVMEYGVPFTAAALMKRLGLNSRENFRKNYLNPALEAGLIKRTVPDKPNSRNQRYIRL